MIQIPVVLCVCFSWLSEVIICLGYVYNYISHYLSNSFVLSSTCQTIRVIIRVKFIQTKGQVSTLVLHFLVGESRR